MIVTATSVDETDCHYLYIEQAPLHVQCGLAWIVRTNANIAAAVNVYGIRGRRPFHAEGRGPGRRNIAGAVVTNDEVEVCIKAEPVLPRAARGHLAKHNETIRTRDRGIADRERP